MKRALSLAFALLALAGSAPADDPKLGEALDQLLSVRESPEALKTAIGEARALGASEQAILEARFLFHVDRHEDAELAAMLPDMLAQAEKFRLEDSQIFAFKEDWLAVVEYVKAIAALQKNDRAGFKKHITEAFWLSPRQGAAFAPHIERVRLDEAMKKVRVPFDLELSDLSGQRTTLAALAPDAPAVLLHFFSPWSRECEESMDDLRAVAAELAKHDIPVIALVGEGGEEAVADTAAMLAELDPPAPGSWLADHPDKPLARTLRIQSAPTMVLVAKDGSVLFNGHPAEDRLWTELKRVAPDSKRPAIGNLDH